jgi:hypothetical protein
VVVGRIDSTGWQVAVLSRIVVAVTAEAQHISLAAVAIDELECTEAVAGRPELAGGRLAAVRIA